jgi:hypothetical protein
MRAEPIQHVDLCSQATHDAEDPDVAPPLDQTPAERVLGLEADDIASGLEIACEEHAEQRSGRSEHEQRIGRARGEALGGFVQRRVFGESFPSLTRERVGRGLQIEPSAKRVAQARDAQCADRSPSDIQHGNDPAQRWNEVREQHADGRAAGDAQGRWSHDVTYPERGAVRRPSVIAAMGRAEEHGEPIGFERDLARVPALAADGEQHIAAAPGTLHHRYGLAATLDVQRTKSDG